MPIYLSSVANRTTEATKTLTLLGTLALPALVITSFFSMNIPYATWTRSPFMFSGLLILNRSSHLAAYSLSQAPRLSPGWDNGPGNATSGRTAPSGGGNVRVN